MANFRFAADTAANWASNNRTPLLNELCFESDTHKWKLGDGATAYNALPYAGGDVHVGDYAPTGVSVGTVWIDTAGGL